LVEVIDLVSSDEDSDDVLLPPPSYRYEVGSDDEDNDDILPLPLFARMSQPQTTGRRLQQ
jgi:hypothetical protein